MAFSLAIGHPSLVPVRLFSPQDFPLLNLAPEDPIIILTQVGSDHLVCRPPRATLLQSVALSPSISYLAVTDEILPIKKKKKGLVSLCNFGSLIMFAYLASLYREIIAYLKDLTDLRRESTKIRNLVV